MFSLFTLSTLISVGNSKKIDSKPKLANTPILGWNSWNKFACDISESLIKETADALISTGLAEVGYEYINLDDCWQNSERDEDNSIVADPVRFPSGLTNLGDYIHGKKLKFGIYSSSGFKTCQAFPASLGLEEIDVSNYAKWGVDYLKYDNCYIDHAAPQKRFSPMAEALQDGDRDILFSLCEWGRENPAAWASELGGHSWRVAMDINDSWNAILRSVAVNTPLWRYAGPNGWNDPDMLEVGNGGCTLDEYRSHFSLWAMMKSPLIIGNDIRVMSKGDDIYNILANKDVIAVNQDPLGYQARRIWSDTMPENPDENLIATKCSVGENGNSWQDNAIDQQWKVLDDGRIANAGNDKVCLMEVTEGIEFNATLVKNVEGDFESIEDWNEKDVTNMLTLNVADRHLKYTVTTTNCNSADATRWNVGALHGGAIQSQSTGRCLEVSKFEFIPIAQGKRIQTGVCQVSEKFPGHLSVDVREHQSWTTPNDHLLNLYQRSCLTIDRDAPYGHELEIYKVPLASNEAMNEAEGVVAVLIWNKKDSESTVSVTWKQMGLEDDVLYTMVDLWDVATSPPLPVANEISVVLPTHGVKMFKMIPVRNI